MKIENFKLKIWVICLLGYLFIGLLSPKAMAQSSTSQNYNLEIEDIDSAPQNPPILPKVFVPPPQEEPPKKPVEKTKGGIKNITLEQPIFFSLSGDVLDFGVLSPGTPVTRDLNISILSSSVDFQIIAFEDQQLTGPENQKIPDTTCDNGSCSEYEESIWVNELTYGFGFRCTNIDLLCLDFKDENTYKQFADLQKQEIPQAIIFGNKSPKNKQAKIDFKLNTSGSQRTGSYANSVTLILAPSY